MLSPGSQIPAHCQATHENHAAENGSDLSTQPQMVSQGPALPRLHGSLERCRAAMSALTGRESLKSLQGRRSTQAQLWSLHPARLVQRSFFPSRLLFGWLCLLWCAAASSSTLNQFPRFFLVGPVTSGQVAGSGSSRSD